VSGAEGGGASARLSDEERNLIEEDMAKKVKLAGQNLATAMELMNKLQREGLTEKEQSQLEEAWADYIGQMNDVRKYAGILGVPDPFSTLPIRGAVTPGAASKSAAQQTS